MIDLEIRSIFTLAPSLKNLDLSLFHKINGNWHNTFLDKFFPFIRESYVWLPFYFFLILFVTINFKAIGWYWVLFFLLTASFSDLFSSRVMKEFFFRLRPCRDPAISDSVRFLVSYCPVSSSFTSSHAVNHFALAAFIFSTFKKVFSSYWSFVFLWAALICYAQVYVGVHFPLDVAGGALLGSFIGYASAKIFNNKIGLAVM